MRLIFNSQLSKINNLLCSYNEHIRFSITTIESVFLTLMQSSRTFSHIKTKEKFSRSIFINELTFSQLSTFMSHLEKMSNHFIWDGQVRTEKLSKWHRSTRISCTFGVFRSGLYHSKVAFLSATTVLNSVSILQTETENQRFKTISGQTLKHLFLVSILMRFYD